MGWKRKRTEPTVTDLRRIERILETDPALCRRLEPKTTLVSKRTGEPVYFAPETVTVAQARMARGLSPERAHVRVVLRLAIDEFGILKA